MEKQNLLEGISQDFRESVRELRDFFDSDQLADSIGPSKHFEELTGLRNPISVWSEDNPEPEEE